MKKKVIIALFALLLLFLSACQATPTQAIVKEKNLDKMIQEATQTQTPAAGGSVTGSSGNAGTTATESGASATNGAQGPTITDKIGAQKTYVKELTDAKGKVKIHVNADVQMPDTTGVTVQRVGQSTITQEQVDALVQRLMKGDLFSGNDYKQSKSEIQTQILQIEAAISNGVGTSSKLSPKLSGKAGTQWLQMQLDQLKKDLTTAPDQSVKTPVTSKLTAMGTDEGEGQGLFALSQPASDLFQSFHVSDYSDGTSFLRFSSEKNAFSKSQSAYFSTKEFIEDELHAGRHALVTQEELDAIPDIKITKEDAKKTADDIVAALGQSDLVCISEDKEYGGGSDMTADMSAYVNPRRCVWFLRYARSVNGVPVTYTPYDCIKVETDQQSQPWSYEDMTFAIDDSGVAYFDWGSPYKMGDEVTKNSNVMSFADAMNVFNTMAPVVNAWDGISAGDPPSITGFDINVNHIVFGLTRVTEQNKRDSGLLVPCWDFFADATYDDTVNGKTVKKEYDKGFPMLTINAIDGSVINRSLGY